MSEQKVDKLGRTGKSIGGRPKGSLSKRSLRQNKQKAIADLFGPIVGKAITKASQILDEPLDSKVASGQLQLSAAKLIIEKAIELNNDVYGKEKDQIEDPAEDDEPEEKGPQQARFVTNVIPMKND